MDPEKLVSLSEELSMPLEEFLNWFGKQLNYDKAELAEDIEALRESRSFEHAKDVARELQAREERLNKTEDSVRELRLRLVQQHLGILASEELGKAGVVEADENNVGVGKRSTVGLNYCHVSSCDVVNQVGLDNLKSELDRVQEMSSSSITTKPHECEAASASEPSHRVAENQHLEDIPLQVSHSCQGDDNCQTELGCDEEQCSTTTTFSCAPSDDDPSRPLPRDDLHTDRRTRLMRGTIQPRLNCYPQKQTANGTRKFCARWYDKFNWLQYSIEKDAAFCFYCRAFPQQSSAWKGHSDPAFVSVGFNRWKKAVEKFRVHEKSNSHLNSILC
ncbi:hypothetical protein HPB49_003722 [Dermacentor silvarum]|uniref:Uncharacterized protein n=1 Tax=Dermacentor silvarum TaxID=543639 RepID=A0ACB8DMA7_DERSI|nr:hypothetical protein HPB49_003722 [Dermacentor silvarum]